MTSEASDGATARKRRIRAAHRSSATRLLGQVDETISTSDLPRLKQLKQALNGKIEVYSKLDNELIKLVEDQLEAEVEQADLIREKINYAVITINDAITALIATPRNVRENLSPSPSLEAGDEEDGPPVIRPIGASPTSTTPHITTPSIPTSDPTMDLHPPATESPHPLIHRMTLPTTWPGR